MIKPHHHVGIHLDKAAIAVPGKTLIAGNFGQPDHGFVIEAKIKNGVHHARHGDPRAGADGNQQGIVYIAKGLADRGFDMVQRVGNFLTQFRRKIGPFSQIFYAFFGSDGKAGWDGQSNARHFRQIAALAANDHFVFGAGIIANGTATESVNLVGHIRIDFLILQEAGISPPSLRTCAILLE